MAFLAGLGLVCRHSAFSPPPRWRFTSATASVIAAAPLNDWGWRGKIAPLGETYKGDGLRLVVSTGDDGSEADRRRLRGLCGWRILATPTAVESTGVEELGSVTEAATSPVSGVPGVESATLDSAIYSAIRMKDPIKPFL